MKANQSPVESNSSCKSSDSQIKVVPPPKR